MVLNLYKENISAAYNVSDIYRNYIRIKLMSELDRLHMKDKLLTTSNTKKLQILTLEIIIANIDFVKKQLKYSLP